MSPRKLYNFPDKNIDRQVVELVNAATTDEAGLAAHIALTSNVHGVTGSVVGTSDAQIISGKKYGGNTNYSEFEADGTLHFVGDATVWNDINISLIPPVTGSAAPSIIAVNGDSRLKCYAFSGTNVTPDELSSSLELLHDYKESSDIVPHLHWAPSTADAGNVKWQLRYMWIQRNGVATGGATITVTTATPGVAWETVRSDFPTISGTGKGIGSRFVYNLFRDAADAADTYAHDAAVFDFGLHFEIDTVGSRQIQQK